MAVYRVTEIRYVDVKAESEKEAEEKAYSGECDEWFVEECTTEIRKEHFMITRTQTIEILAENREAAFDVLSSPYAPEEDEWTTVDIKA